MKTFLTLAFFAILLASTAHAQSYSITSATVDGGGGSSSGTGAAGSFAITGAIAQPDASAAATGGSYSLTGGFFGQYLALQQLGAPRLIIRPAAGGNVQVVWGANVPGWVLQQNGADLAPAGWSDVAGAPTVSGGEQYHQFPAAAGRQFFRLRKL